MYTTPLRCLDLSHDLQIDLLKAPGHFLEFHQRCLPGCQLLQQARIGLVRIVHAEAHGQFTTAGQADTRWDFETVRVPGTGEARFVLGTPQYALLEATKR